MASNRYRRGATWWGRLWVNGTEYRRSLQTTDEHQAEIALERWRDELVASGGNIPTWKSAVVNWLETVYESKSSDDGLKPNVRKGYRDRLRPVSWVWADKKLSECNKRAVAEYVKLRKKGFTWVDADGNPHVLCPTSNANIRRDLTAISSVFRAAVAAELSDENPARDWDRTVIKERRRYMIPPIPEEIETVMGYACPSLRRAIAIAANTGMRREEVAGLEWRDIRTAQQEILLPRTKVSRPRALMFRTPGGDVTGTLTGTPRHITSPLVVWHGDGERYRGLTNAFVATMQRAIREEKKAGRELRRFRFHDLRHAFACRWLINGGDIHALKKHLGHTSVQTTEKSYLCFVVEYGEYANRHNERHNHASSAAVAVGEGSAISA